MAVTPNKGQIVLGTLVTPVAQDTFPIAYANDLYGGRHIVETIADRNAISASRRQIGMLVYVKETEKDYILKKTAPTTGNTTNNDWDEYKAVPANLVTEHNKVEDIQYRDTTNYTYLIEKLNWIDDELEDKLTEHQKLEDISYRNPPSASCTTLSQKLALIDTTISQIPRTIEQISWGTTPSTHQSTLSGEINHLYTTMNDPTKITVPDSTTGSATTTLRAKLIAIMSDVNTISNTSINSIEDLEWGTTPSTPSSKRHKKLSDELNTAFEWINTIDTRTSHINDPSYIYISSGTSSITLASAIENLASDINTASQTAIPDYIKISNTETLMQRLNKIGSDISAVSSTANAASSLTVEDIEWGTTPSGSNRNKKLSSELTTLFSTIANMNSSKEIKVPSGSTTGTLSTYTTALDVRLAAMSKDIIDASNTATAASQAASSVPNVNAITWTTTQTTATSVTRSTNLATDINNIVSALGVVTSKYNSSKEIKVPSGSTTGTLSTYTTALDVRLAAMSKDIIDASNTATAASQAISSVNVENVTWSGTRQTSTVVTRNTNLATDINNIVAGINTLMSDPTKIAVPSGTSTANTATTTLKQRLIDITTSLTGMSTTYVNSITWSTTQTTATGVTRNTNLATDINNIVSAMSTLNSNSNNPTQIKVPNGTTTSTTYTTTLESRLIQIQKDLNSISSTANAASTVYVQNVTWSGSTPTSYTGVTRSSNLGTDINNIASAVGTINTNMNIASNIKVAISSSNNNTTTLPTRLNSLESATQPSNITISGTTLDQWITNLQSAAVAPTFLLFAANKMKTGAITTQEFLTHQSSKLVEIAMYTNPDATIGGNISVSVESCSSTASTYGATALTSITLGTSNSGKLIVTDLSASPITIARNVRLRINITSIAAGSTIDLLSVRLKLMPN